MAGRGGNGMVSKDGEDGGGWSAVRRQVLQYVSRALEGEVPGRRSSGRLCSACFGSFLMQLIGLSWLLIRTQNISALREFLFTISFGLDFAIVLIGLVGMALLIFPLVIGLIVAGSAHPDRSYVALFRRGMLATLAPWGLLALLVGVP